MAPTFNFKPSIKSGLEPQDRPWRSFPEYNFVGGHNDPDSLSAVKLAEACNSVILREGEDLATYCLQSGPQGYIKLREFLVGKLHRYAGMNCSVDDILLTSGSLQAIDLINEALIGKKSTVIVEESNYGGVLSRLNRLDCKMIAIPVDEQGMQTDKLHDALKTLADQNIKPEYIYTIPTVHNPTGTIMSEARRAHLIELAIEYDVPIFEDECYADLVWAGERPQALYAMDSTARVVHVGSFSKTIAPALRVGYVVANWSLMGHLLSLKTDAGSGALEQMLLAEYCINHFDDHVKNLNANLHAKLLALTSALDREFGTSAQYRLPPGGIFLWVSLPANVDTAKLAQVAGSQGVALNPGVEWSLQSDSSQHLRLCFANPSIETIDAGISKLAEICFQEFGVPQHSQNRAR